MVWFSVACGCGGLRSACGRLAVVVACGVYLTGELRAGKLDPIDRLPCLPVFLLTCLPAWSSLFPCLPCPCASFGVYLAVLVSLNLYYTQVKQDLPCLARSMVRLLACLYANVRRF